jgi:outer membrane protein TolC
VALSRERVVNAETRRRETDDKARSGAVSYLEVLNANLDWYKARGQLVTDVMGWYTSHAQLRQAMGLLVAECCPK